MAKNETTFETNKIIKPKITRKQIFSYIAIALAFIAIVLYFVLPAIKIDPSYAAREAWDSGRGNIADIKGFLRTYLGFNAMFGIGTYDVYVVSGGSYDIVLQTESMHFNIMMLISVLIAVSAIVLYGLLIILKKKNAVLNKVAMGLFVGAAFLMILTAVWFYAFNPIVESNFCNSVTKQDTIYKFVNAHLGIGPIISTILLVGSGVFTSIGEY